MEENQEPNSYYRCLSYSISSSGKSVLEFALPFSSLLTQQFIFHQVPQCLCFYILQRAHGEPLHEWLDTRLGTVGLQCPHDKDLVFKVPRAGVHRHLHCACLFGPQQYIPTVASSPTLFSIDTVFFLPLYTSM